MLPSGMSSVVGSCEAHQHIDSQELSQDVGAGNEGETIARLFFGQCLQHASLGARSERQRKSSPKLRQRPKRTAGHTAGSHEVPWCPVRFGCTLEPWRSSLLSTRRSASRRPKVLDNLGPRVESVECRVRWQVEPRFCNDLPCRRSRTPCSKESCYAARPSRCRSDPAYAAPQVRIINVR